MMHRDCAVVSGFRTNTVCWNRAEVMFAMKTYFYLFVIIQLFILFVSQFKNERINDRRYLQNLENLDVLGR